MKTSDKKERNRNSVETCKRTAIRT